MLRFGPETGPVVVVALPLFEEANRTRTVAVTMCRALAKRGVASVLPDLPGQGESPVTTGELTLATIQLGFAAAVEHLSRETRRPYAVAVRSGAMAVADARTLGRWYLSPVSGPGLLDELGRILMAAHREGDADTLRNIDRLEEIGPTLEIAGNRIGTDLLRQLARDVGDDPLNGPGVAARVVRLDTDRADADRHVPGPPLWRRAEPGNDPALAALLANDIADWIAHCDG